MVTYKEIRENEEIREYIRKGNANLGVLGYTDHSVAHCAIVAEEAGKILEMFGYSEHEIELAKIAGFMHDIGNCVNRSRHAEYGGLLANEILKGAVTESKLSMNAEEKTITLNLEVDEKICTMYEYFEIFLGRMMMCRSAAEMLGAGFRLRVNGSKVL